MNRYGNRKHKCKLINTKGERGTGFSVEDFGASV